MHPTPVGAISSGFAPKVDLHPALSRLRKGAARVSGEHVHVLEVRTHVPGQPRVSGASRIGRFMMPTAQSRPLYEDASPRPYGAPERVIAALCDGMAQGHDVTLLRPAPRPQLITISRAD